MGRRNKKADAVESKAVVGKITVHTYAGDLQGFFCNHRCGYGFTPLLKGTILSPRPIEPAIFCFKDLTDFQNKLFFPRVLYKIVPREHILVDNELCWYVAEIMRGQITRETNYLIAPLVNIFLSKRGLVTVMHSDGWKASFDNAINAFCGAHRVFYRIR